MRPVAPVDDGGVPPQPVALLRHSDQQSQHASEHFQELPKERGVARSLSRAGEVWDNSAMESIFSLLRIEPTARKLYRTKAEARAVVFDCIERSYNPTRGHSKLGTFTQFASR